VSFDTLTEFDFGDDGGGPIGVQPVANGEASQTVNGGFQEDGFHLAFDAENFGFAEGFAVANLVSEITFTMTFDIIDEAAFTAEVDSLGQAPSSLDGIDAEVSVELFDSLNNEIFGFGDLVELAEFFGGPLSASGTPAAGSYTLEITVSGVTTNQADFFAGGFSNDLTFDLFIVPAPGAAAAMVAGALVAVRRRR